MGRRGREVKEHETVVIRGGVIPIHAKSEVQAKDILVRDGTIKEINNPGTAFRGLSGDERVVDARGALVLPGFINAHTHSYGTLARTFGSGLPLEPWMMFAWSITGGRSAEEVYLSAFLQGVEALLTGTTAVLDHLGGDVALTGEAARAYRDLGIRAAVSPMISDIPLHKTMGIEKSAWPAELEAGTRLLEPLPAHLLLEQTRALHTEWHGTDGLISVAIGPSAPQRCSPELLDGCAQLSQELGLRVHTHFLETRMQAQDPNAHLDVLERHGLVNEKLMGAHAVWANAEEVSRLGEAGATLVHNPQSNLQLGSGIAELRRWRASGVNSALGTDGANCGGSLNMLSSMRLAAILHRPGTSDERTWETPWTALDLATIGGARALGLERVGRVEVGWSADLAVFDISGTPFVSSHDPVTSLVLSTLSPLARHVLVAGRIVVSDGVVDGVDIARLTSKANRASEAIFGKSANRIRDVAIAQQATLSNASRAAVPNRAIVEFDS